MVGGFSVFKISTEWVGRFRSVSHGPDQPRTAPSSPPHRLHFPSNSHQLSSGSARLTAGQRLRKPVRHLTPNRRHTHRLSRPDFARLSVTLYCFHAFSSTRSAVRKWRSFRTFLHSHARTAADVSTSARAVVVKGGLVSYVSWHGWTQTVKFSFFKKEKKKIMYRTMTITAMCCWHQKQCREDMSYLNFLVPVTSYPSCCLWLTSINVHLGVLLWSIHLLFPII